MPTATLPELDLPGEVKRVLEAFVAAAVGAFGSDLCSITLYGSAAEGRLRATSDVNVILVLHQFQQAKVDELREPLRVAQAAIQLRPMFLLKGEIGAAADAFAQKFADILRRRRVLHGEDPFAELTLSRQAELTQLKQQLLNLTLRLRVFYAARSLREEQLAPVIADAAGPLRSCAAALLELQGQRPNSAKEALERLTADLNRPGWAEILQSLSQARETRHLPPGVAGPTLFRLVELAEGMRHRAESLS
ncbi:MAG: hypothetical protein L0212_09895 [Acidobacteria bacterium]|nr:hypothetical protein [Acidobacteriota bacterium]